jgi:hypothetical protein
MPVRVTPQQATAKWLTGISGANERMKQGALNVQTAPGQLAAAAADKWLAKVTAAKPKFIANSKAVSLQDWQNSYINTGLPRVTQGAQDKQAKYTNAMGPFFNYMNQGLATIDKMPKNTIEDSVQRAAAMIRWNAKYIKGNAVAGG